MGSSGTSCTNLLWRGLSDYQHGPPSEAFQKLNVSNVASETQSGGELSRYEGGRGGGRPFTHRRTTHRKCGIWQFEAAFPVCQGSTIKLSTFPVVDMIFASFA